MPSIGSTQVQADNRFFLRMAMACALVAVGGFSLTYIGPLIAGAFTGGTILHLHGLFAFAWMALFVVQAALISSQSVQLHRTLGIFGIALATAVVFTATSTALQGMHAGIDVGYGHEARELLYMPMNQAYLFSLMVIGAIIWREKSDYHKRFMLLATITLLPPAVARVVFFLVAPPEMGNRPGLWLVQPAPNAVDFSAIVAMLANLMIIPALVHDWRSRGKPHVVYIVGGGLMILTNVLRGPVSRSDLWHSVAGTLAAWNA